MHGMQCILSNTYGSPKITFGSSVKIPMPVYVYNLKFFISMRTVLRDMAVDARIVLVRSTRIRSELKEVPQPKLAPRPPQCSTYRLSKCCMLLSDDGRLTGRMRVGINGSTSFFEEKWNLDIHQLR